MEVIGQRHTSADLLVGERFGTQYRGGWMGRSQRLRKISPPPGIDPWTVPSVASRYTDSTILST
jgi:hypothetical protein